MSWVNPSGGSFSTGVNWSGGVAPGLSDTVVFNLPNAYVVGLTQQLTPVETGPITITAGSVAFSQNAPPGNQIWRHGGITVNGATLSATLDARLPGPSVSILNGGRINGGGVLGGNNGPAFLEIRGAGSRMTGITAVGSGGSAEMLIEAGGELLTASGVSIGADQNQVPGAGTVTIRGAGSRWVHSNSVQPAIVGGSSAGGRLFVESGGTFETRSLFVGYDPSLGRARDGWVAMRGPSTRGTVTGPLLVGTGYPETQGSPVAIGTLSISDGAILSAATSTDFSAIGRTRGAGTLIVENEGSRFDSPRQLIIGQAGVGFMSIRDGAVVTSGIGGSSTGSSGTVGNDANVEVPTGGGTVEISGAGSAWVQNGTLNVAFGRPGNLSISNGGAIESIGGWVGRSHAGVVSIDGANSKLAVGSDLRIGSTTASFSAGTLTVANGGDATAGGAIRVTPQGSVLLAGGRLEAGTLDLAGGRLVIAPATQSVVRANAATILLGGFADLADRGMIVDYTGGSPVESIVALIVSGRAGGAWTGTGINSSAAAANPQTHAVGIAEADEAGLTELFGETFDSTTVVVRYTLLGDANLDGFVGISDFGRLAVRFNQAGNWVDGDFNYDATVGVSDFSLLAANFNKSLTSSGARSSIAPEPVGATLVGAIGLLARRLRTR